MCGYHNKLKKTVSLLFLGMLILFSGTLWAQNLEIHYINVQQGQCTLIIGPDGTTILYDAGAEFKGTGEVVPYLQNLGIPTSQALDYMVVSHRHTDHYRGLTEVIDYGYDALNIYDNGSTNYNIFVQDFLDAAAVTTAGAVTSMPLGTVINLGNGATATCVAVNGSVIGSGAVAGGQDNENDRSLCLLVQYGDFDFLVTGDLGGGMDDVLCTGRSTSQVNMETPMLQAIMPAGANPLLSAYGVEVVHVGHHGSESSTNSDYMNILTPSLACISVGPGQGSNWYHPRIDVVENVLQSLAACVTAPSALVLQTEEGTPTGVKTSFAGYSVGDIVITTSGVYSYTVSASGAVSQGPDERTAAGLPATYYFDEYLAPDTAPILYDIHEESVSRTSAVIEWSTNESSDSVVKYGTTAGSYPYTASNSSMTVNHGITLSGLTQFTTYYYIVESTDSTNNTSTSEEYSFSAVNPEDIKVVFSEVIYDTPGTDSVEEWIELYNNSPVAISIGGWKIYDNNGSGSSFTIPDGTVIASGTYYTVAADSTGFYALYGYDADAYGGIPGLNNSGDALVLKNKSGVQMDAVGYEGGYNGNLPTGWGSTTEPSAGTGYTIVRTDPTSDTDTYADWSTDGGNGYPQTQGMNSPDNMLVVFSEIFYDTPGTDSVEEWVELYNNSPMEVNIGGWKITDNNGSGSSYTIPQGEAMAPYSYYTIAADSTGFNALYGRDADVYGNLPSLNNSGDTLLLEDADGRAKDAVAWEGGASGGVPTGWSSSSEPSAPTGSTIIRTDPAWDSDMYTDWSSATGNGFPQTQAVKYLLVISEVYYDTVGNDGIEEWVEIYNNSPVSVDISGWKITDNNGSGGTFTIPDGESIEPGSFYTIAADSTGFNALYGFDADLYGDLPALNNTGEALILKDARDAIIDAVGWEGGSTAGLPDGWGSASEPSASTGNTIVRSDETVDNDTYADWTTASNNGNPQTQSSSGSAAETVVFSEIYYDTVGTDSVEEWIELYNNSSQSVDVGGWTITDNNGNGSTYTIPTGTTIAAGTYLTIAKNSSGFYSLYSYNADVYGSIPSLGNSGDALILKDSTGTEKDAVGWEGGGSGGVPTGWGSTSAPSAGTGSSIVRSTPTSDTDTYSDWTTASGNGNPQVQ